MPSTVSPPRRHRADTDGGEEQGSGASPSTDSSRSSKRQRGANSIGASPPRGSLLPNDYLARPVSVPNGSSGSGRTPRVHQPGSIVRVKLTNFVTYKSVDIYPGPSLNMVIGPNGTGKSTLVCAICLGLGWEPKYLGRQKEISEFVKHGENEADIEIELKGRPRDRHNTTIRCHIKRDGNKSTFSINGKPSNKTTVQKAARSFSIQIDNLCQFLPQDKVVEFAAMSPVDLLRSTLQAVASEQMTKWHDELIEFRQHQRTLENNSATNKEMLGNLETRQRLQEADVERVREREHVLQQVENWRNTRRMSKLMATRKDVLEQKKRLKQFERDLQQLQSELAPALAAVHEKEDYLKRVKTAKGRKTQAVRAAEQQHAKKKNALEKLQSDVEDLHTKFAGEKKSQKDAKVERARLQGALQNLENEKRSAPPAFDVAAFNEQLRGKERRALELEQDELPVQVREMDVIRTEGKAISQRKREKDEEIKGLDSQAGKQASKLHRLSRESFEAWKYIEKHPDLFEKPVYGPPIISCSVKDQRYVPQIEALFSRNDFMTFTVQTNNDFETLHKIIHEDLKLGEVNLRTTLVDLERFKSQQFSDDKRRDWGFDGWALDYVEGPIPVLAMLCELLRLHITGVALQDTNEQQYNALHNSTVGAWVTSKSIYKIARRREYGPGATSTSVNGIKPPQVWTDQPVDQEAIKELQREKQQLDEDVEKLRSRGYAVNDKAKALKQELEDLRSEINGLKDEKDAKQKAQSTFRALPTKIESVERKIQDQDTRLAQFTVRATEIIREMDKFKLLNTKAVLEICVATEQLTGGHEELQEIEIMLIEATSDHETLVERNKWVNDQLETKKREVKGIAAGTKETELRYRQEFKDVEAAHQALTDAQREFVDEHVRDRTLEEVDAEFESEQARLALMHGEGHGRVLQEFESRGQRIATLKARMADVEAALAEVNGKMSGVRAKWEPRLKHLIRRISDAFAFNMKQINCAGEVGIYRGEGGDNDNDNDNDGDGVSGGSSNFEQWAVQIQVKFREDEPLTQLDSHRQSGGERAVSTIFYLMSLQALTRSPFRVVDEINQGMDPRNERLVHSRMVAIATGNDEWEHHYRSNLAGSSSWRAGADGADLQLEEDGSDEDAGGEEDAGRNAGREDGGGDNDDSSPQGKGSQYFLITPKLLHGLRYEEGMRVLCIASGEHMQSQNAADFGKAIAIRRSLAYASG